jgi:hypothetical protein
MVSWFRPQNQAGYELSIPPQNRWEDEDGVGHTSRSSSLLHLAASRARFSMSGLKTGGDTAWMVHVTSSQRLHRVEGEDGQTEEMGYIAPFYPNFAVFIILGPRAF